MANRTSGQIPVKAPAESVPRNTRPGQRLYRADETSRGSVPRMRRMKAPLFSVLFLGLCGGWMASCSDDEARACVPQETRLCAGVGRCQGVQSCLPDGSGWGDCDCSGPPREGTGGTMGDMPLTPLVGRACTEDAQCGEGLTCFTSTSNDFLGGGPAHGYCSLACNEDAQCTSIDGRSECVVTGAGASGLCIRTCRSGDPASVAENKCLGRIDLACNSEAFLGLATFTGARQVGWCYPQCGSDEDCPGRRCDLARGLCVDTLTEGLPFGARCTSDQECAGRRCAGVAPGEAFCSAPCVFGQPTGCGFGLSASPRGAACVVPQVQGILSAEGAGDVGLCGELCAEDSECEQAASRGWVCQTSANFEANFGRPGLCNAPPPADAGAGADSGAGPVDASTGAVSDGG